MGTNPDADTIRQAADETAAAATIVSGLGEHSGAMIGRYKLLQPLGEGGMGTVWMAGGIAAATWGLMRAEAEKKTAGAERDNAVRGLPPPRHMAGVEPKADSQRAVHCRG